MKAKLWSILTMTVFALSFFDTESRARNVVVADFLTRGALPKATIYDRRGVAIGITNKKGVLPYISPSEFPITLRYTGYYDKTMESLDGDTIFLEEKYSDLPEFLVNSPRHRVLHILAYVREYSTMNSYTDTVFLFREKLVDYMLPMNKKVRFAGWAAPRVLKVRSYYRFTDKDGLDSVSNAGRHHFSWSDWVTVSPKIPVINSLKSRLNGTDTLRGKYSVTEVWNRDNDRIAVEVNVLADTVSRKWVPSFKGFFKDRVDFDKFNITYDFANVLGDTLLPADLTGYGIKMESKGRGHDMFRFNRRDEPFYVTTDARYYILERELISVKEAKQWEKTRFDLNKIDIYESTEAPPLDQSVLALIDRVNSIDPESVRSERAPDRYLVSNHPRRNNFSLGNRMLSLIKGITGISTYKSNKNRKDQWRRFKKEQIERNRKRPIE